MTKAPIKAAIVAEKVAFVRRMIKAIRDLPLTSFEDFSSDDRNAAAGESYLRRALESLFDLSRHILAKGFARAPVEYKEIVVCLEQEGIITGDVSRIMREMAGYRNRMVHFYDEIRYDELYKILRDEIADIEKVSDTIVGWLNDHPEKMDNGL